VKDSPGRRKMNSISTSLCYMGFLP
jgi:hypothetical protein